jgi:hypothetical protein
LTPGVFLYFYEESWDWCEGQTAFGLRKRPRALKLWRYEGMQARPALRTNKTFLENELSAQICSAHLKSINSEIDIFCVW